MDIKILPHLLGLQESNDWTSSNHEEVNRDIFLSSDSDPSSLPSRADEDETKQEMKSLEPRLGASSWSLCCSRIRRALFFAWQVSGIILGILLSFERANEQIFYQIRTWKKSFGTIVLLKWGLPRNSPSFQFFYSVNRPESGSFRQPQEERFGFETSAKRGQSPLECDCRRRWKREQKSIRDCIQNEMDRWCRIR